MIIFGSFNGLDYLGDKVSFYASTSFGNIGFSQAICGNNIIEWHGVEDVQLLLQCQGSTQIDQIVDSGVFLDDNLAFGTDPDVLRRCYMTDQ